jgi:tetratricopeptide (TPR) repeat protein
MTLRFAALAIVCAMSSTAFADARDEAQKHIEAAAKAHEAGKLTEALAELNIAYTLDPQPELLYSIGQLHVQLGQCDQAITFYQRFIATKPPQDEADVARQAIDTCKTKPPPVKPIEPIKPPPPPPPPPPQIVIVKRAPEPRPFYTDVIGDALVAVGVVGGVAGILEYSSALSDLDRAKTVTTYDAYQPLVDDAHHKRTFAVAFGIGGAALVAAGIVRFVMVHDRREPAIALVPTAGGGLFAFSRRF